MRRWFVIFALCTTCFAQTQGGLPTVVQSLTSDSSSLKVGEQIVFKTVDSGTLLFGCQSRGQNETAADTLVIVDNQLNTWNFSTLRSNGSGSSFSSLQCFYTTTGSSGLETITFSGVTGVKHNESVADFGTGLTVDGSFVGTTSTGSPANISASITTTVNGDAVIAGHGVQQDVQVWPSVPAQFAVYDPEATQNGIAFLNGGAAGVHTITFNQDVPFHRPVLFEWILAFSHALAITDTLLPDADKVQAYSTDIHTIGGTGTYACTLQSGSLPTGLALGGTGNCTISGTASSATGNYPITIRSTESGGSTFVDSSGLSIKVGAAFGTPAIVQSKVQNPGPSATYTSNVTSGNALLVLLQGYARHPGGQGYIMPTNSTGGKIIDTLNTNWVRVGPLTGDHVPALAFVGCATSSGADTVTFTDNQSDGSTLNMLIAELSNTQPALDVGVGIASESDPGNLVITTPSLTIPVNNESLFALTVAGSATSATAITPTAPFTTMNSTVGGGNLLLNGSNSLGVASGSTTMTSTITSVGTTGAVLLFGLRPAIAGLPCGGTPVASGSVPHRRQEY